MSESVANETVPAKGREFFVLFFELMVATLVFQFIGRKLRASGWADWSSYVVATAFLSLALFPVFKEKELRRKLIGSLWLWLICLSGIVTVYRIAPFLLHSFPTAVAYGISCFIFLLSFALG